ncbi:UDP-N-acetylmuramate dehydrogenase [Sphingobacterium alkalisoli]|uniref:UDP-N-acetylenolpyruvoylglucosamine reductase n=1 Tax=Sphingobacterium alkalisoli TaxID=1874115 RepID=A0A4U0GN41_9SPHI|nr:UDP-N-acetylmuramate dehydrogenase [Sphingobacterium alkalisoli]TJY60168.1 UDP-N-acetylmuramate dehydrogenase [Sphingobacterium alkalisoli]GGH32336.1 UDP-N-acetylenolpyruvoylglucosamine reductase [Sphingobacterium alkalisoli]
MKKFEDFDLTNFNSYRVKAVGREVFFPETEQDVIDLYTISRDYILLGSGHNIILTKEYYDKPIIVFNGNFDTISVNDSDVVEVEAGAMMHDVAQVALEHSLKGIEIFYDIPSSLGGAVVMNAGASGEEIKDVLVKVRYFDLADLQVKEILKEDISFEYRNSFFQRNTDKIVLKAWMKLDIFNQDLIREKMETIKAQRWAKQPKEFPNGGSVFKRPQGYYVGAIIDELKLKGYTVGGAKISEKHGGFIVNFADAKGSDIVSIIEHVNMLVHTMYGFELEVEQRII